MKKKLMISVTLACLLALGTIVIVLAGSTYDFGLIAGTPPANEANWTAWINETKNILAGGMPNEIMTEDNTASDAGVNFGYSQYDGDPEIEWILQVENFSNEVHGDDISMIFGGLGVSSGKLWNYTFTWDQITNFETNHSTVPLSASSGNCPVISEISVAGDVKTITFIAEANKSYHVYKTTQASGAGNGAGNGRYLYLKTVVTNGTGTLTFSDTEPLESWYTIIRANATTNALDGCHSEETAPTAVTLADFTAQAQFGGPAVNLVWNTLSEIDLVGFNVYRAADQGGPREKLNANLIPAAHPGQMRGDQYSFADAGVAEGHTYSYWIEAVKKDGTQEEIGPQTTDVPNRIFLPILHKAN